MGLHFVQWVEGAQGVCVCVCVCVRERERERERDAYRKTRGCDGKDLVQLTSSKLWGSVSVCLNSRVAETFPEAPKAGSKVGLRNE